MSENVRPFARLARGAGRAVDALTVDILPVRMRDVPQPVGDVRKVAFAVRLPEPIAGGGIEILQQKRNRLALVLGLLFTWSLPGVPALRYWLLFLSLLGVARLASWQSLLPVHSGQRLSS